MINKLPPVCMLLLALCVSGYSQAATISFNAGTQDVAIGSHFTLNVLGTEFPSNNVSEVPVPAATCSLVAGYWYWPKSCVEKIKGNVILSASSVA